MEQSAHQRFIVLYEVHRVPVYHMALSLLKNAAAAEDVMQEVFLSLYETMEQERMIRNIRAWLLTVTRNRCLNHLRDNRYEIPADDPPLCVEENMEDEVMGRILSGQILRCITAEENLIFSLHCLDGYKYREIAEGMDLPIGTVQTKCRAARQKLKAALRDL